MIARAIRFSLVFLVLCGLVYPLAATGLARLLFPRRAEGSLVRRPDGAIIGSELIGQPFARPDLFHGRISPSRYDASATAGASLGPSDPALHERIRTDVAWWRAENPGQPIPADLLTGSGSGVDPHISPAGALAQIPRISRATGIAEGPLRQLVDQHTAAYPRRLRGAPGELAGPERGPEPGA